MDINNSVEQVRKLMEYRNHVHKLQQISANGFFIKVELDEFILCGHIPKVGIRASFLEKLFANPQFASMFFTLYIIEIDQQIARIRKEIAGECTRIARMHS